MSFQPVPTLGAVTTADLDDYAVIRDWTVAVKATGSAPSRMPGGYANAGELASRDTGPGTDFPSFGPPFDYTLAPANVRAADHRIQGKLDRELETIVPPALNDPTTFLADLKKYAIYGGIGLAGVLLITTVINARRR